MWRWINGDLGCNFSKSSSYDFLWYFPKATSSRFSISEMFETQATKIFLLIRLIDHMYVIFQISVKNRNQISLQPEGQLNLCHPRLS